MSAARSAAACALAAACLCAATAAPAAAAGRANYETYCSPCHGVGGGGDGPLAPVLDTRPARHDDASFMAMLSDAYVMRLLEEGGPALGKSPLMGKWGGRLTEEQLRETVAYMRTLARRSPP